MRQISIQFAVSTDFILSGQRNKIRHTDFFNGIFIILDSECRFRSTSSRGLWASYFDDPPLAMCGLLNFKIYLWSAEKSRIVSENGVS
jgi:hypothetical protein